MSIPKQHESEPRRSGRNAFRHGRLAAFTLIEILLVVGVIAVLAGVGIVSVANVRESTRVSKLGSDTATINAASQVYRASGGAFSSGSTPQQILDKLKTRADATSAAATSGLRGSMVDRRLRAEMQTSAEAATSQTRALWDATAQRFVLATSGASGVKNFLLDDELASVDPGTEGRTPAIEGSTAGWVWDYADVDPVTSVRPGDSTTAAATAGNSPTAPNALQLNPPAFAPPGGAHPLIDYDIALAFSNPNPRGSSQIYFSIDGAAAVHYTGQSLTILPGSSVTAYAVTSDPDHWEDSEVVTQAYQVIPVTPSLSVATPAASLTYAQAGGAMTVGALQTPAFATISLNNASDIPAQYLASSRFRVFYGIDGDDPRTSGEAGPAFSGAFVSPSIDVSLARWGTASSLVISAATRALDTMLFADSAVDTATIDIARTLLPTPAVDPPSGLFANGMEVTISVSPQTNLPEGYRIYYTTDGIDPGNDGQGRPSNPTAILHDGEPLHPASGPVMLIARTYGPPSFEHWFTPSAARTVTYTIGSLAGVLVSKVDKLNGIINGSVQLLTDSNFQWNGSTTINGDLYLPGSPIVFGNKVVNSPSSLTVRAGTSASSPPYETRTNYTYSGRTYSRALVPPSGFSPTHTFEINSGGITGTIYTQATPNTNGLSPIDATYLNAVLTGNTSTVPAIPTSNVDNVGVQNGNTSVYLAEGNYGSVTVGGTLHLGSEGVTSYYNFKSLRINGSGQIVLHGPVVISLRDDTILNNIVGTTDHPDWLTIYTHGLLTINGGGGVIGRKIVSLKTVTIMGKVTLTEGVIADGVTVEGGAQLNVGTFQETN